MDLNVMANIPILYIFCSKQTLMTCWKLSYLKNQEKTMCRIFCQIRVYSSFPILDWKIHLIQLIRHQKIKIKKTSVRFELSTY